MSNEPPPYPEYPGPDEPQPQQPPPPPGQQPPPPPGYGQPPPAYGQPAYGQQPYGYGYAPAPSSNGKALAGMITGIVSIVGCYVGLLIGPVAIILSVLGRKEIKRSNGTQSGQGMATAGLITGIVGTVVQAAFITLLILSEVYDW